MVFSIGPVIDLLINMEISIALGYNRDYSGYNPLETGLYNGAIHGVQVCRDHENSPGALFVVAGVTFAAFLDGNEIGKKRFFAFFNVVSGAVIPIRP